MPYGGFGSGNQSQRSLARLQSPEIGVNDSALQRPEVISVATVLECHQ